MSPAPRTRRHTRSVTATVLSLGLLAVTACGSGVTSPEGSDRERIVLANCDREVVLPGTPQAIVGMSPGQTELFLRLGLGDRMVGQAQTAIAPLPEELRTEAEAIPVLSEQEPPSREALLRTGPDFVFSPTSYEFMAEQGFASIEQLTEAGAGVYIATAGCPDRRMTGTVDDLFTDLENLGRAFDVEEAATELTEQTRTTLEEVRTRVEDRTPVPVAQVYVSGDSLSVVAVGVEYDMIRQAGGDNLFSPDEPEFAGFHVELNPEELIRRNPQALVFAVNNPEHEQATRDYLTRTFPDLDAVRNDRLIAIPASATFPGTLGNVDAVVEIAEGLHPEAF